MTSESLPPSAATTRAGRRRSVERQARRSALLTVSSTVAPGSGLVATQRRRLGIGVLAAFAVVVAFGGYYILTHGGPLKGAAALLASPRALLAMAVVTSVGALVWAGGIVVTNRLTRPLAAGSHHHWLLTGLTAVLCLAVLVPSARIVQYVLITRSTLGTVSSLPQRATAPTAPAADPWASKARVNVLLLGSDAGKDRIGVRTDSMMIASINTKTGDTVLFGVPRNLERAPVPKDNPLSAVWPNGYDCGDVCLINALWTEAESHKDLFGDDPSPGLTTIRGVLEEVLGLSIDHTVIADLAGFRDLVDAVGGVEVNVQRDVAITGPPPAYRIDGIIKAGRQVLDGYHALWYARSRYQSDDFDRMKRQRCVVGALVRQVQPITLLSRYPQIAAAISSNVQTDIPQESLGDWADLVIKVQKAQVRSLALTPENISVVHPDYDAIHAMVAKALNPPTKTTAKPTATNATASNPSTSPAPTPSPSSSTAPDSAVDLLEAC